MWDDTTTLTLSLEPFSFNNRWWCTWLRVHGIYVNSSIMDEGVITKTNPSQVEGRLILNEIR